MSAGVAAPTFLSAAPALPLNLEHTTWTITDESAQTRLPQDGRQLTVPVTYQEHVTLQDPSDKDSVTLRVGTSWLRGSQQAEADRLIDAQVWTFPMDRLTGEAEADASLTHTIGMPTADVPVQGLWMKFPANAEKTTYDYFDPTLRGAAPAVFEEELEMDGRTVYRYHQQIEPTNVATRYAGTFTTITVGAKGGAGVRNDADAAENPTKAFLFHSASRDLFVDQQTGMIVDMDVSVRDFYGDKEGKELENALTFDGSISDEDTAAFLAQTEQFHHTALLRAIRWGLIGGGALLSLLALLGVFGLYSRRAAAKNGIHEVHGAHEA